MVKQILTDAGFIENETFKETRFLKAPDVTYCVYLDSVVRRGADNANLITEHRYTVELYAYAPDPAAEDAIEEALDALAIPFEKQPRYWINDEQIFQTVYDFDYIEK